MSTLRPKRAKALPATEGAPVGKTPKWKSAVDEQPDEAFVPYAPSAAFSPGALLVHPKFGKGLVLTTDGGKMFVLFQEGIKKLVHAGA